MKMKRRTKVLSVVVLAIVFIVAAVLVYQQHTQTLMVKRVEKQITEFENQVKNDGFQTLEIYSKMIRDSKIDLKNKNKDELKTISENIEKMSESEAKTKKQYDELLLNVEKYNDLVKKSNLQIKQLNNYYDSSKNVLDSLEINKFEEENQTILEKIKLVDTLTKDKKEVDDNIEQWTDKANFYAYYDSSLKEKLDKKTASYSKFLKKCDTVKTANTINKIKQMVKKWDDKYKKRSTVQQEANKAFADYLEKEYEEEPEEDDDSWKSRKYLFYMIDIDNDSVDELIYADEYDPENNYDDIGTVKIYDFRDGKVTILKTFDTYGPSMNDENYVFFNFKESKVIHIVKNGLRDTESYSEIKLSNKKVEAENRILEYRVMNIGSEESYGVYKLDGSEISEEKYKEEKKKIIHDLNENYIPLFPKQMSLYEVYDVDTKTPIVSLMKQKYKNGLELGNYNEIRYALSEQINTVDEYDFGEATQNDAKILDAAYRSYDKRQNIYNTDISNDGIDEKIDIAELYSETNDQRSVGITINDKKYYKLSYNIKGEELCDECIQLSSGKKIILLYEWNSSDWASDYKIIIFNNNRPYLLNTHALENIGETKAGCDTMKDMLVLTYQAYTNEAGMFGYARFLMFKGKNISLSKDGYWYEVEEKSGTVKKTEWTRTTKKEFYIYKDKKCKIKLCKIKKNVKMNFVKCVLDKKGFVSVIRVKTGDTVGWLKVSNKPIDSEHKKELFENCEYFG